MRHHRCLIPASGFYEWRRTPEGKQAYWIAPADGRVIAFAGLWDTWSDPDGGDMDTGAILTVPANRTIERIHHRMPAILLPEDFDAWLDTGQVLAKEASGLLRAAPEDFLVAAPVSDRVNKVANDDADIQAPVPEPAGAAAPVEVKAKASAGRAKGKPDPDQFDLF